MTSQLLSSELLTLIQDSKKKNPDLRNAAEKSLADLKALPNTSEAQVAADLKRRPDFVKPFVLACNLRNPKFATSGVTGLLRLVVSNGLSPDSLRDILQAFQECTTSSLDVQLKVLQALPSLLQNYAENLKGRFLISAFQVCFSLHGSKTAVVSNTAAASLQQLLTFTFENVANEDRLPSGDEDMVAVTIQTGSITVHRTASDAYHLLNDICLLTEGSRPKVLDDARLTPEFGLELLDSLLAVHVGTIAQHEEDVHIFRARLMPFIIKLLSEKASYNVTVRTVRLLRLLVRSLLPALAAEIEMVISLINHMLEPNSSPTWKRALCLELYRDIHDEPTLVRNMYTLFDETKGRKNLIGDHLAILVRLAAEKPAVIGLGQRSSGFETQPDFPVDQIAVEAGGLSGAVSIPDELSLNKQGINANWSTVRTSCIDQVDKSEPPMLPATYLYSLVLTCINRFSDGLAKFLLPFTIHPNIKPNGKQMSTIKRRSQDCHVTDDNEDSTERDAPVHSVPRAKRLPINPLTLRDHEKFDQIVTSARMIEKSWPALLATSSTFLNASLDSDYYHTLIRSVQRFTQVAGLLDLTTPRDAFLTTLAKHAVPFAQVHSMRTPVAGSFIEQQINDTSDSEDTKHKNKTTPSLSLTPRNLLCLRALLNLGTALGPVLQDSWSIVFDTLHQVDVALEVTNYRPPPQVSGSRVDMEDIEELDDLNVEKNAIEVAVSRLFESTSGLPNQSFIQALDCICSLAYSVSGLPIDSAPELSPVKEGELSPNVIRPRHHRLPSLAGVRTNDVSSVKDIMVILERTNQMVQCNTARFCRTSSSKSGWSTFTRLLIDHLCSSAVVAEVRITAVRNLDATIRRITSFMSSDRLQNEPVKRCLEALSSAISCLWKSKGTQGGFSCSLEIHSIALGSLLFMLEECGDTLRSSWDAVFSIINSVFEGTEQSAAGKERRPFEVAAFTSRSSKLVRSAFASLQLICSDFLASIPNRYLLMLLHTQHCFCSQGEDLNVSLTVGPLARLVKRSVALFRNISDFLQLDDEGQSRLLVDPDVARCTADKELMALISAQCDDISKSILWMCLILHLARLSIDHRMEVRHSALHTLFGIFDACGHRLDAEAWVMCFRLVFSRLLSAGESELTKPHDPEHADVDSWNETSVILARSISKAFMQSLGALSRHRALRHVWVQLLANFALLLKRQSLGLSRAIFGALTEILCEIERISCTETISLDVAWVLWRDNVPTSYHSQKTIDNNDALTTYLRYVTQLHSMLPNGFDTAQAETVMATLRSCITHSAAVAYGSDVDVMTPVQKLVLEALDLLPKSSEEILTQHVEVVSSFVGLAFQMIDEDVKQGKTYIALSKAAMETVEVLAKQQDFKSHGSTAYLLAVIFQALAIPIRLKYKWQREGKGIPSWKKATSTFLSILDTEVTRESSGSRKNTQNMWEAIASICDGILAADTDCCDSPSTISTDQAFDIESFLRLQNVIIPALGSPSIPDKIRRQYISSLFEHSLLHEPHPDDLARPEQELLDGLRSQHVGRVQYLPSKIRSKMAYVLVDQLFDLAAVHDGSAKRVRLAQIAAPYMILRAGLVLKAYVCDQPLRGLMPQPLSQKKEMHYVLKKLVDLNPEPKAIPATSGVQSDHKKHLFLVFGLVTKALKAARKDEEMRTALTQVLDTIDASLGY
ncbi:MAG: hypothetical protein Q9213_006944 [Squamulea squamosa]